MYAIPIELQWEILCRCTARSLIAAFVSKDFFAMGYAILKGRSTRPDLYDISQDELEAACKERTLLCRKIYRTDYCLSARMRAQLDIGAMGKSRDPDILARTPVSVIYYRAIVVAARNGNDEALFALIPLVNITTDLLKILAKHGKLGLVGLQVTNVKLLFADACACGNMAIINHLLAKYPEEAQRLMSRGIVIAALCADKLSCKKICLYLIDRGDNIIRTTALNHLCRHGAPWIINILIEAGARLMRHGILNIFKACRTDLLRFLPQKKDFCKYLLHAGRAGDMDFICAANCKNLNAALTGACEMYRMSMCNALIAAGADYCACCDILLKKIEE